MDGCRADLAVREHPPPDPGGGGDDSAWRWQLLAPDSRIAPQCFLETQAEYQPVGRSGADVLLLQRAEREGGLIAVDVLRGTVTPLGQFEPLAVADCGVVAFVADPAHDHHLDGKDAGVAQLVLVPLDGGKQKPICTLPHGVERGWMHVKVAPDGRYVAWSTPWDLADRKGASLTVVERETGRTLRSWSAIEIAVSPASSSMATLEFAWLDAKTLRYGDTELAVGADGQVTPMGGTFRWVDVAIDSGDVIAIHPVSQMELRHGEPSLEPEPAPLAPRAPRGLFEVGGGKLWFLGDEAPVADFNAPTGADSVWFRLSPDGRFALLERESGADHESFLLLGGTRQRLRLAGSTARMFGWFAAPSLR